MNRYLETHLQDRADEMPDKDAFRINGEALSFADLATRSDRLARLLMSLNVGPGDRVGIYMDKCFEMPVAVYGILKTGAAYVPLDGAAPPAHTAGIIADCEISVLLTRPNKSQNLSHILKDKTPLIHVIGAGPETDLNGISSHPFTQDAPEPNTKPKRSPSDPAYILFTSGSTGTPKGMLHTHTSGLAYMDMILRLYGYGPEDRMGNHAPLHFDMAMMEFFCGISVGATVVMIPEMLTKLPASLSKLIEDERLTTWYSVPFALIQLAENGALDARDLSTLRWISYAGAPMSSRHLNQLQTRLPNARFSNAYGPAEANQVTYHHLPKEPHPIDQPIPIGTVCDHTDIKFTPEGELLIATPAMMEGYWNRPDLNANAFLEIDGKRYYRTGDLVERLEDGTLIYLGRKDRQVKIRGFRIELDEVELVISSHPSVFEVAVIVAEDGLTLEAFVTSATGHIAREDALIAHVRERLPAAFVPSKIDICAAFTRTATGKIDRTALRMSA